VDLEWDFLFAYIAACIALSNLVETVSRRFRHLQEHVADVDERSSHPLLLCMVTLHLLHISSGAALYLRTMKKRSWAEEHDTFQIFETIHM